MRAPLRRALVATLFAGLGGCCLGASPGASDCDVLVDKILACDPSAAGVPRAALSVQCAFAPSRCASIDVSAPDGCAAFMGCLYDG